MLELFQTCCRALEYNKLHARVGATAKPSLAFGSAIHTALEYRYKRYKAGPVDFDFQEEVAKLLTPKFEANPPPIDDWRNLNWALEVVRRYNEKYPFEAFNLLTAKTDYMSPGGEVVVKAGEPLVELPFMVPLFTYKDIPVYYTGRIDLPVMIEDQVFVIDHKTTSMLGSQFFERAAMLAQQRGYVWAFREVTGMPLAGYIVNGIRTKEPPLKLTSGSASPNDISKWWNESFQRERFYLDVDAIDEWKNNTIHLVEEFFWHYSQGYMPMKTGWCTMYGRCQYYDVCTLPAKDRGVMLSSNLFTDNVWSPLKEPSQPQV